MGWNNGMQPLARAFFIFAIVAPVLAQAENWARFEDTDEAFWDSGARMEVDLDSVRKVDVPRATDAAGKPLAGPFVVAVRRAVLSDSGRSSLGYDSELTTEYYTCAGKESLRTVNGSVLSAEITGGKRNIKHQGRADEAYAFKPATTGWQKNLQSLVCARARAIES